MKCQHCQNREAVVSLNIVLNQHKKQIALCDSCFHDIKEENGSTNQMQSMFQSFMGEQNQQQTTNTREQEQDDQPDFIKQFGRNLSDDARRGAIDPVIGRDEEVERVIQVLSRRTKNNPVLIGEAGVGKTAIAEGLALRIVEGKVPSKLMNKQIFSLDFASLVAGTSYRGQFEERMQQLIDEVSERDDLILFIDELHMMVGAGASGEGNMDASNLLKPALARGNMQLIGATTLSEYRKIEKDAALERRFQPVSVKEPTVDQAVQILQGLKNVYETYHGVRYSDEVIEASVKLSDRYIQDRFLPDKAIDLLDEVGSLLSLTTDTTDKATLEQRLATIQAQKQTATKKEDYEQAASLRDEEVQIKEQLNAAASELEPITVRIEDIQALIERQTGIPVQKLQKAEQKKMKDLSTRLAAKVIGQDDAVSKTAKAVKRSRAGLKAGNRPISFLFVGPTGVGKTELTKQLAQEVYGKKESMIRFDMSEFMEKHAVSKLIGSPPGYVGHEEGGQLTERVRRNPYSIILLDEIEKAHPDVQHIFLQIMEDGHLTDSHGRTVSFKDTMVIMTSNAGVGTAKPALGFQPEQQKTLGILESLKDYFKPEFLNRFDALIEFNQLDEANLVQIVDVMLDDLRSRLATQGISLEVSKEAKVLLAKKGYHPAFGARPLRRVIQDTIEDDITDLLIDFDSVSHIIVETEQDELVIKQPVTV
ncbi:ATP-dependent Clp protease ATP-binding subunit ClpE [Alkalihalobacillus xiaoxiensis]|uniref:ATP-dependent Clp protease ATP-binding subunit ClpE n=1 Tax=Shouchella xiaoxiensis TaxID=766895 RepID=A0ABS2SZR1_9BACI|nr:ATP-dependent Clp protease ATP-binding subunit [Shouchella xiaoxiensis]MBM7841012.1 ATP-dependent Clp protease ATP-binding subunit ClpE [Shouchella xiaoxiensis]